MTAAGASPRQSCHAARLVAERGRLSGGPLQLTPGGEFRYRLVLDSALLGTFPVVEEVTGIGVPGAARSRPQ